MICTHCSVNEKNLSSKTKLIVLWCWGRIGEYLFERFHNFKLHQRFLFCHNSHCRVNPRSLLYGTQSSSSWNSEPSPKSSLSSKHPRREKLHVVHLHSRPTGDDKTRLNDDKSFYKLIRVYPHTSRMIWSMLLLLCTQKDYKTFFIARHFHIQRLCRLVLSKLPNSLMKTYARLLVCK